MTSFTKGSRGRLLKRFGKDRRGSIMVAFAGASMCLMMLAAGGIEMHRRNLAVAQLQGAADAAALAGKQRQTFYATKGDGPIVSRVKAQKFAKDMFEQSIAKASKSFGAASASYIWNLDGSFTVSSTQNYSFLFGSLMPTNFKKVTVKSTADFSRSTPTEVAMVLDTTASMFEKDGRPDTRFTLMREASKKFANQLFDSAQAMSDPNLVRVAVVPWATSVNIKGEAPAAADFSAYASGVLPEFGSRKWVASPIARAPDFTGTSFAPVQWRGCVSGDTESKTTYTDAAPGSLRALSNSAALIHEATIQTGPLVATPVTVATTCAVMGAPYTCPTDPGTQGFHKLLEKAVPQLRNASFLFDKGVRGQGGAPVDKSAICQSCSSWNTETQTWMLPQCGATASYKVKYCHYYSEGGRRNSFLPVPMNCSLNFDGCYDEAFPPKEDQSLPACVGDPNEPAVINETVPYCAVYITDYLQPKPWLTYTSKQIMAGPNVVCPMPMLGLSANRKQVIDTLDRMSPVPGGTHTDVGLRWGLRTLSKNNSWPTFFGLTKAPDAFGGAAQKVMVLITDGENEEAKDYRGYWGCGLIDPKNRPDCAGTPTPAELDTYMQGWCDSIRNTYKVQIYAIAVNMANAAAVARLQSCVGDPSKLFSVDAADLTAVLSGIAARVMALRLVN